MTSLMWIGNVWENQCLLQGSSQVFPAERVHSRAKTLCTCVIFTWYQVALRLTCCSHCPPWSSRKMSLSRATRARDCLSWLIMVQELGGLVRPGKHPHRTPVVSIMYSPGSHNDLSHNHIWDPVYMSHSRSWAHCLYVCMFDTYYIVCHIGVLASWSQ